MANNFSEWPLELFRTMLDYIVTAQCQADSAYRINETLNVRANVRKVARLRLVCKSQYLSRPFFSAHRSTLDVFSQFRKDVSASAVLTHPGVFDSEVTRALAYQLTEAHASSEYDWRRNPHLVAELCYQQVSRGPRNRNVITYSINNMLDLLSARAAQSSISLASREDYSEVLYALFEGLVNLCGASYVLCRTATRPPLESYEEQRHEDLFAAVACMGDEKLTRILLGEGADPNAVSLRLGYPSFAAARAEKKQMMQYLLSEGVHDPDNYWKMTPLEVAALGGLEGMLPSFTTARDELCVPSATDWGMKGWRRLVLYAVEGGNARIVEELFTIAASLSGGNGFYQEQELPFTGWWLESDKNEESFNLETLKKIAFLEAARWGRVDILKCLLVLGVDIDAKDEKSRTALLLATAPGFYDCVKLLLENGATVRKCNMSYSAGVLGLAVEKHHIRIVRLLLEYGALDPECRLPEILRTDLKMTLRGNSCKHGPLIIWLSRKGIWMHWQEVMRMASEVYGLDPDCKCLRRHDETGVLIRVD
ncbi:ankyrin [Lophium mytilinum]|uniref:Ankyrin n=1 Tax=Lophium mytilinum TaxID=390894 RepID=A0A6A6R0I4_9PEZI|nr:ankyrin [Lophium mytilinum]